jgi:hypothetical protein
MIARSDAGIMPLRSVRILILEIVTGIHLDDQNPSAFSENITQRAGVISCICAHRNLNIATIQLLNVDPPRVFF